ncbi:hypothetical protein KK120_18635 [Virgibacillus dakarensis]|nr:hypothetical protein [Virgibacillus dakarensis]
MFKVYTPNKHFNGTRLGVSFINGVGETDDKGKVKELEYFGYKVEQVKKTTGRKTTSTKKSGDE